MASILGNRVLRREDPKLLTVGGTYVDDLALEGAAHVVFVRSTVASARLVGLDASVAAAMPGVLAVVTADDLDLGPYPRDFDAIFAGAPRPFLATGQVRYVGEPVAAVVALDRATAVDAAEAVVVDYDPLPTVVDPEAALEGSVLVHPEAGTNVCYAQDDPPIDFDRFPVVVRARLRNQRVAPCPLEPPAAASAWGPDGRLTHWASTQGPHPLRDVLAEVYGLARSDVRVVVPDVGGGFGSKMHLPEELLCPWLARRVGRPVRLVETRSESMVSLGHGRAQRHDVTIAGDEDGTIRAYALSVLQDAGAYPRIGSWLPALTRMMCTGTYAIEEASVSARSVLTNTVPVGAYRGAGRPEAAAAIERAVDLFAGAIGMDPAVVRQRNLVPAQAFPYRTAIGTTYDSGRYGEALRLVLDHAGFAALREEQAARRAAWRPGETLLGIGLSVYVETTGERGGEYARVELDPSGRAVVLTGTSPHGQGHETAWAMLVAEQLGIEVDAVTVRHGDTDVVPAGGFTGGSRSAQIGGVNVWRAAGTVAAAARSLAAELLEADPADVVLDPAGGHVRGAPAAGVSWSDIAAANEDGALAAEGDFASPGSTFPSGAHLAVVEVDPETGGVTLERLVAVDDAGRILAPLLAEGQVHGGLAQGAAQALLEEMAYDDAGNPLTTNLADYPFVSATELPSFETLHLETPTDRNELGVKGIGESGTIGSTPAVQNAVVDALAHLGVRHVDMPATPERVWRAIREAAGAAAGAGAGQPA